MCGVAIPTSVSTEPAGAVHKDELERLTRVVRDGIGHHGQIADRGRLVAPQWRSTSASSAPTARGTQLM